MDDAKLLENVRLAAGCGAAPTMLLTVALTSSGAKTVDEAFDRLNRLRSEITSLDRDTPRPHAALAELEPELIDDPPVARMRLDLGDHELRGRLVFGELLGKRSFMQVAALAIAGIEISESDGRLLEDIGVLAQMAHVNLRDSKPTGKESTCRTFTHVMRSMSCACAPNVMAAMTAWSEGACYPAKRSPSSETGEEARCGTGHRSACGDELRRSRR